MSRVTAVVRIGVDCGNLVFWPTGFLKPPGTNAAGGAPGGKMGAALSFIQTAASTGGSAQRYRHCGASDHSGAGQQGMQMAKLGKVNPAPALTILLVTGIIVSLAGCAFLSPRAACPGGAIACNPLQDTNPEPELEGNEASQMQQALRYSGRTQDQLSRMETEIDLASNLTNYAILGTVISTASLAAFTAGRDAIVGLGFGSSGLLGFQYVSGMSAKRKALDQGLSAIACVKRNAIASYGLSRDALGSPMSPPLTADPVAPQQFHPTTAAAPVAATNAFVAFQAALQSSSTTYDLANGVRPTSPPPVAPAAIAPAIAARRPALMELAPGAPAPLTPAAVLAQNVQTALLSQVVQAQRDFDAAKSARDGAIQAVVEQAPQVLNARVTMIKESVFAAMHNAEPSGQQVADFAKGSLKTAQTASDDARTKSKNVSGKVTSAISIAPTVDVQRAAPAMQQANAQQEQDAAKVSAIVDEVTEEATSCKNLIDAIGKGK